MSPHKGKYRINYGLLGEQHFEHVDIELFLEKVHKKSCQQLISAFVTWIDRDSDRHINESISFFLALCSTFRLCQLRLTARIIYETLNFCCFEWIMVSVSKCSI